MALTEVTGDTEENAGFLCVPCDLCERFCLDCWSNAQSISRNWALGTRHWALRSFRPRLQDHARELAHVGALQDGAVAAGHPVLGHAARQGAPEIQPRRPALGVVGAGGAEVGEVAGIGPRPVG